MGSNRRNQVPRNLVPLDTFNGVNFSSFYQRVQHRILSKPNCLCDMTQIMQPLSVHSSYYINVQSTAYCTPHQSDAIDQNPSVKHSSRVFFILLSFDQKPFGKHSYSIFFLLPSFSARLIWFKISSSAAVDANCICRLAILSESYVGIERLEKVLRQFRASVFTVTLSSFAG